jgi:hypothetical protein
MNWSGIFKNPDILVRLRSAINPCETKGRRGDQSGFWLFPGFADEQAEKKDAHADDERDHEEGENADPVTEELRP